MYTVTTTIGLDNTPFLIAPLQTLPPALIILILLAFLVQQIRIKETFKCTPLPQLLFLILLLS